ncbi:MAG: DNA polymerase III subunit gamma/tau [Candidatus Zixiibacteriota bacterium]
MSYLVFARKYRPQLFSDIVAQEHVTKTLQNSIKNDRIGSGYLFCGPRGTGKTTTARILAKAINCVKGPSPTPCNECSNCIEITKGTSLDVLEIDAASNTGVDDIRLLRENVRYMPTSGKKRIYIIDEVHRLSGPAFDALLKTLEEPPPHVIFIFATTEPLKVPDTILSRTQRFDFKRVSVKEMTKNLIKIAQAERLKITETALSIIARKADGSVRDSLSLLDQIAAYATGSISDKEVVDALGLVDRKFLFDFITAIASEESTTALKLVKNIFESGVDPKDFVLELLEHLRILLILTNDKKSGILLNINPDELQQYLKQADYFSVGDILLLMKITTDLNRDLKDSGLDERLLLEMNAVKMAETEATVKFEEILNILRQGVTPVTDTSSDLFGDSEKKKNDTGTERVTFIRKDAKAGNDSKSVPSVYSRSINLPIFKAGWENFLTLLHQKRPMIASQLGMVEIREVKDNNVLLVYPSTGENSKLIVEKPNNINLINSLLREHFKANLSIRFDIDHTKEADNDRAKPKKNNNINIEKLIENSPRIRKLLEKVEGQIIGVKKINNTQKSTFKGEKNV